MPSSVSFAAEVINLHFAAGSAVTWPIYASLHTTNPGADGAGEVSNSTYSRIAVTFNAISTQTSLTTNDSAVTFGEGGDDETVTHVGLWHGSSGGTYLSGGTLTSSFGYGASTQPVFDPGSLSILGNSG